MRARTRRSRNRGNLPGLDLPEPPPVTNRKTEADPVILRLYALFRRRPSTPLGDKEKTAFRKAKIDPDDLPEIEAYYSAEHPKDQDRRRRDLGTLLNNWPGELDRARAWVATHGKSSGAEVPAKLREQLNSFWNRPPEAQWTREETAASAALEDMEFSDDDVRRLTALYKSRDKSLTKWQRPESLLGLLKNFAETLDFARRYVPPSCL